LVLPINEIEQLSLSLGVDQTEIKANIYSSRQLLDYLAVEGDSQEAITLGATWARNSLNRGLFPTAGTLNMISSSVAIPPSDVTYGKLVHKFRYYTPAPLDFIFSARSEIGALFSYGDTKNSPPYQNFYAGGLNSVRGFKQNTLGPRSYYSSGLYQNNSSGGAYLLEGGFDMIFSLPFFRRF
jgi:outer membrane protein insertion porin family